MVSEGEREKKKGDVSFLGRSFPADSVRSELA